MIDVAVFQPLVSQGEIDLPEVGTSSESLARCCLGILSSALLVPLYNLCLKHDVQSFSIATCLT
jgi:hypothetical protein